MSNRRRLQEAGKPRRRYVEPDEALEEWRRRREVHELALMAVEDDEPIELNRRIDTPGPEWTRKRIAILLAWLAFGALVLCGCVAWIVEALT